MARVITPWCADLLARARPQIVSLHAGPERLKAPADALAKRARGLVPDVRLHVGVGCDYWVKLAARGGCTVSRAVQALVVGTQVALDIGAEAAVADTESASKLNPVQAAEIARAWIGESRVLAPRLILGHTAYDQPHNHGKYPWAAWLGTGGVDWELAQVYCAPEDGAIAQRGALQTRRDRHKSSWQRGVRSLGIRADLPVDWYHQGHHVPSVDTIAVGCEPEVVMLWGGPELPNGRLGAEGAVSLVALCELERLGSRRLGGIADYQRQHGYVADGVCGPKTLAALGIDPVKLAL
jgi:hypothetical protein